MIETCRRAHAKYVDDECAMLLDGGDGEELFHHLLVFVSELGQVEKFA